MSVRIAGDILINLGSRKWGDHEFLKLIEIHLVPIQRCKAKAIVFPKVFRAAADDHLGVIPSLELIIFVKVGACLDLIVAIQNENKMMVFLEQANLGF